jgi:magnesium chelatase subunit I
LLDRFGLNVALSGHTAPTERGQIIRRRLDFDSDPQAFCAQWETEQHALRSRCESARKLLVEIPLDDAALALITERCFAAGVDGLRADLVWLRAARAHAAWRGADAIAEQDIDAVAEFALRHRRREQPSANAESPAPPPSSAESKPGEGQGQWGEMPATAQLAGARREVPSWPPQAKKP